MTVSYFRREQWEVQDVMLSSVDLQNSGCPPIRLTQVQANVYSPGVKSFGMVKVYSSGDWPFSRFPSMLAFGHWSKSCQSINENNCNA